MTRQHRVTRQLRITEQHKVGQQHKVSTQLFLAVVLLLPTLLPLSNFLVVLFFSSFFLLACSFAGLSKRHGPACDWVAHCTVQVEGLA